MNIAILGTRGVPARYGGFETFAEELGTRLVQRGHRVTVFCEPVGHPLAEYRGMALEYVTVSAPGRLRTIVFDAKCLWRARRRFDLVYMLGYGASVFCFLPRVWGTPVWINMDGIEWKRAKWNKFARLYLRIAEATATLTASHLIADSQGVRDHLVSTYPYLRACTMIPYGAQVLTSPPEASLLQRFEVEPEGYHLVVCRLEPENHVKEMVEGYLGTDSRRPLLVVGDDSVVNDYVRSICKLAGPRVRFVGTIYDPPLLQALRFCCFAYFHGHSVGGTNPSLLEAMGCSNLVVAHDNVFNREVLGPCGLFFSTPEQLAESIRWAESHSEECSRLKSQAVLRIKALYDWKLIADKYCELLSSGSLSGEALARSRHWSIP
jgi:glycosyltransferase involved in cell wall biosynthesis